MKSLIHSIFLILLSCTAVLCSAGEKPAYDMDIFPMNLMNGQEFAVAENLPAVWKVRAWAGDAEAKRRFGKQTPVLILETPAFLSLTDAALQGVTFQPWHRLTVSRKEIRRDGHDYIHYEVPFFFSDYWNNLLGVGAPHPYNEFCLYLKAARSGPRSGTAYARVRFGREETPERAYRVGVIPAIKPLKKPAKLFEAAVPGIAGEESGLTQIVSAYTGYWRGLTDRASSFRGMSWKNAVVREKLTVDSMMGSDKQFLRIMTPEYFQPGAGIRLWRELIRTGKVPKLIGPDGKASWILSAAPAWYLVDDPEGLYEKYLTEGCRMFRKHYPYVRRFYWDYEPGVDGMDRQGLERFARVMNLPEVPSLKDVAQGELRRKWFRYMIDLHQKHLEKAVKIFRKELPGTEFWICTDNLHAGVREPAYWCAVDPLLADKTVDGHLPMPYYSGTRYFDDIRHNTAALRKPVIPLNDPAEMSKRFFDQYTPDKVCQNIAASAALGCRGWGLWPDLTLSGRYFQSIRDAWSLVAQAEDFYFKGRRCDSQVKIHFKNTVEQEFPYGKNEKRKVSFPDYSADLRYTLHEKDGEYLLTVFNYHDTRTMFIEPRFAGKIPAGAVLSEIDGVNYGAYGPGRITVKIPPAGVKALKLGKTAASVQPADSARIRRELEADIRSTLGNLNTEPVVRDGASASWRIPAGSRRPMLMLKNPAGEQILIDAYGQAKEIVYWHNVVNQLPAGGFFLFDQSRIVGPYPFRLKRLDVNGGTAAAEFEYVFKTPDAGEGFMYQDLTVTQRFAIGKQGEFTMSYTIANPSKSPMKLGFRVRNRLFREYREITFGTHRITPGKQHSSLLFMRKNAETGFLAAVPRQEWNGEPVTVRTKHRALKVDAADFDGIYIWNGAEGSGFTLEPVSRDLELAPGETRTYRITVHFRAGLYGTA